MAYTTKSGALSAAEVWTAGTYYISAQVTLGSHSLEFDCSAGPIIIKVNTGVKAFLAEGTGVHSITTSNTTLTNKVYITSKNDNTIGEPITGSSGSPARGDYLYVWSVTGTSFVVSIDNLEIRYAQPTSYNSILGWDPGVGNTITLRHVTFKNCGNSTENWCWFIGNNGGFSTCGLVDIQYLSVDSTNVLTNGINSGIIGFTTGATGTYTVKNVYINAANASTSNSAIYMLHDANVTAVFNFENICIKGNSAHTSYNRAIYVGSSSYPTKVTIVFRHCYVNNVDRNTGIMYGFQITGCASVTGYNCIAMNFNVGYPWSGLGGSTYSCAGYGNTTNSTAETNVGLITTDPAFGNIKTGEIITAGCVFPDGLAVTNLSDYEKKGNDTYDNLGLDNDLVSPNGYYYYGTDKVTPGIYYEIDELSPYPNVPVLSSPVDDAIGQNISVSLDWNASLDATSYRLQVSTNVGFTALVHDESGITATIKALPFSFSFNTEYFWRVNATNSIGTSAWSTVWSFTTATSAMEITVYGGSSNIDIPNPQWGYTNRCIMAMKKSANGNAINWWDNGATYDAYECDVEFLVTAAQAAAINTYYRSTARSQKHTLSRHIDGFYPFDVRFKDAAEQIDFWIMAYSQSELLYDPYLRYRISMTWRLASTLTAASTAGTSQGTFELGSSTVTGLMQPQNGFKADTRYALSALPSLGGDAYYHDKAGVSDEYSSRLEILANTGNAQKVMEYFLLTTRGSSFSMLQKSNYTVFGADFATAATYTGKVIDNVIEHKAFGYNQWSIGLTCFKTNANI